MENKIVRMFGKLNGAGHAKFLESFDLAVDYEREEYLKRLTEGVARRWEGDYKKLEFRVEATV